MTNYILLHNGDQEHYFYKPYEGLCMRRQKNGLWQEYQILYRQSLDHFSVFIDENQIIHIICANSASEIVYLLYKGDTWHKYTLAALKEDIRPEIIKIAPAGGRLQLLYSAQYEKERLLVHCVLGNQAQPTPIDKIAASDFFISGGRVYYTNAAGALGYQDLSDGKPDRFVPIAEQASMPYVLPAGQTQLLTYIKDNSIYFQNKPVYAYKYAEDPILVPNENRLLLLWRDGDFIRYLTSLNGGATWSTPMQFVNPGKSAELYYVQKGNAIYHYYGNHSAGSLHIFGTNDLFAPHDFQVVPVVKKPEPQDTLELAKIKIMIDMTRAEIVDLKREIKMLRQESEELKSRLAVLQQAQPGLECI